MAGLSSVLICVNISVHTATHLCIYTHPKIRREDIVRGDHHILRGQKLFTPVSLWTVIQIHIQLHIRVHVLLKLVLHKRREENDEKNYTFLNFNCSQLLWHAKIQFFQSVPSYQPVTEHREGADDESCSCF